MRNSLLPTLRGHLSIDSPSSTILCRTSFEEICQLMTVSFRAQNATYQTRRQEVIIVAKERGAIILSLFAQRVVALGRCNYSLIMLHISFLTCQSCEFLVSTQQQQLDRDSKLVSIVYQLLCQIANN